MSPIWDKCGNCLCAIAANTPCWHYLCMANDVHAKDEAIGRAPGATGHLFWTAGEAGVDPHWGHGAGGTPTGRTLRPTDRLTCEATALGTAAKSVFVGCGNPERVLVAGDVHGNLSWAKTLVKLADRHQCQGIVQLGDFGYWSHTPEGERFLDNTERALAHYNLWLVFIPGNHENHELLRRNVLGADGFYHLRDHLAAAPFGARWSWRGVAFGALGGAFSIDYQRREPGTDWWPGLEEPGREDAARLGGAPLDVLLSHDAPAGARGLDAVGHVVATEAALRTRVLLAEVVKGLRPSLVLHGHWHHRNSTTLSWVDPELTGAEGALTWSETVVEGLAADIQGDTRAWGVLCLDGPGSFRFVPGNIAERDL